ncbi:MAG: hypothetical protein L3K11_06890 [Thermoplasmata archaeon]|nr:hypothetical protein [Thermoplasmata archaeon]
MVHIRDEGSAFDVPVAEVWKLLTTPSVHLHKNRRNRQMKPEGENRLLLTQEQEIGGRWEKVTQRISMYPPLGMVIETLEGPLAGSNFITYYTPQDQSTGVTVVGEFVSPSLTTVELERAVHQFLEEVYREDSATLGGPALKG